MLVIPASANINTRTHILETPNDIVINSQVYNKTTMRPDPYSFYPENWGSASKNRNVLFYDLNSVDGSMQWAFYREHNEPAIIRDNQEPNVHYYIHRNGSILAISKTIKQDRQYSTLWTISPNSGWAPLNRYSVSQNHYKYLGQSEEYIVCAEVQCIFTSSGGTVGQTALSVARIKKSDGTVVWSNVVYSYDMRVQVVKADNNYIFLYVNAGGAIHFYRYSIPTNTILNFFTDLTTCQNANCIGLSNIIQFKNHYYCITASESLDRYALQRFIIDFDVHTVIRKEYPLATIDEFPFHLHTNTTLNYGWMLFTLRNVNNQYIGVTAHDNMCQPHRQNYNNTYPITQYSAQGFHRSMMLKYCTDSDTFVPICHVPIDSVVQHIYGVLYYDDYHLMIYMSDKVQGWRFNPNTEQFILFFEKVGKFAHVGFDSLGRLYLCDTLNKVRINSKSSAALIHGRFVEESYYYDNTPIQTSCLVYAKNFLGAYVATTVKITLLGNCIFEDGTNEKIMNTAPDDRINIPVSIVGPGDVGIHVVDMEV